MAIRIQEARDKLNRLSPDELRGEWMSSRHQIMVQVAMLGVSIAIDISEIDRSPDDKIKELIHNRMISALEDRLSVLKGNQNERIKK